MKLNWKQISIVFLPAILIVGITLTIRILQYKPLYPETNTEQKQQDIEQVPVFPNDAILGSQNAAKTIVAFEDLSCGACKKQHEVFKDLIEKHPNKVKVVWKGLPIKNIPISSEEAHRYAFCMNKQDKFQEFADYAFTNSNNLVPEILQGITNEIDINQSRLKKCLNSNQPDEYIQKTKELAKVLNIQAVPSVFVNGEEVRKPSSVTGWKNVLNINK